MGNRLILIYFVTWIFYSLNVEYTLTLRKLVLNFIRKIQNQLKDIKYVNIYVTYATLPTKIFYVICIKFSEQYRTHAFGPVLLHLGIRFFTEGNRVDPLIVDLWAQITSWSLVFFHGTKSQAYLVLRKHRISKMSIIDEKDISINLCLHL
jgi:hypothetical protein